MSSYHANVYGAMCAFPIISQNLFGASLRVLASKLSTIQGVTIPLDHVGKIIKERYTYSG